MAEIPDEKAQMKADMREAKARKPGTRKKAVRSETQTVSAPQAKQTVEETTEHKPDSTEASEAVDGPEEAVDASERALTIRFTSSVEFNPDHYDLIILPYGQKNIAAEFARHPILDNERLTADVIAATNKFEAPYATLPDVGLLLIKTATSEQFFVQVLRNTILGSEFSFTGPTIRILDCMDFTPLKQFPLSTHLLELASALYDVPYPVQYDVCVTAGSAKNLSQEIPLLSGDTNRPFGFEQLQIIGLDGEQLGSNVPEGNDDGIQKPKKTDDTRTHFLADHATDEDLLGYHPYAMGIAEFVKDTKTTLPLTIAIDGAWGKGKSSLMKMLRNELDPNRPKDDKILPRLGWWKQLRESISTPLKITKTLYQSYFPTIATPSTTNDERRFVSVFINAWRHGKGTQLKAKIVSDILTAMTARFGSDFLLRLQMKRLDRIGLLESATKTLLTNGLVLGIVLILSTLLMASIWMGYDIPIFSSDDLAFQPDQSKSATTIGTFALNVFLVAWRRRPTIKLEDYLQKPDYLKLAGSDAEIEADFRRILAALQERNCHLALFIDDLDRCAPNECAAVVEALNTFFGSEGHECLFVLGMHRELVASALDVAYKDLVAKIDGNDLLSEQKPFGRRFLEKIVQFTITLPEPDDEATKDYLDALTSGKRRGSLKDAKELAAAKLREERRAQKITETNNGTGNTAATEPQSFVNRVRSLLGILPSTSVTEMASGAITARLKDSGIDVGSVEEEAQRISDLKDRIDERKNANENEYIEAFKLVKDVIRTNPRQYKRFFNKLRFYRLLNVAEANPMFVDACEAVMALEHPNLYYRVIKCSGSLKAFADEAPNASSTRFKDLVEDFDNHAALKSLRKKLTGESKHSL